MSPEYVMQGIFSTKSYVFSFGVLLLEIVSSKKNHSNYHYERPLNLIGYVSFLNPNLLPSYALGVRLIDLYRNSFIIYIVQLCMLFRHGNCGKKVKS